MTPALPVQAVGRAVLTIVALLPVLLIVVLFTPAWLTAPFLPASRRRAVLNLVQHLRGWHTDTLEMLRPP